MEQDRQWARTHPNAFMDYNHIRITETARDRAVCELELVPESLNPYGYAHGGAILTIIDDAAGSAAHTDGRAYVTQNSAVNFLGNQTAGTLRGAAVVRHRGRSTCLVEVTVTGEGGRTVASGFVTYFCVDQTVRPEREASPS